MTLDRQRRDTVDATFRNGSITAISVLLGFSLSFLLRWAALPGPWEPADLVAVSTISLGIALQIVAVALLLSVRSLEVRRYQRAIAVFLTGLGFVALGTALVILGDISGLRPQHLLGG